MSGNIYDEIEIGHVIDGPSIDVTKEMIREFAEASFDFNALHLDDAFMERDFGKTKFRGVIAHGMMTFSLMTRMMTDWLWPRGGIHRRLETRWLKPVYHNDTITFRATVSKKLKTLKGQWILFDLEVKNQHGDLVAAGESMAESP
jgi:3-hydroxybutyryl-CoA dehydratase